MYSRLRWCRFEYSTKVSSLKSAVDMYSLGEAPSELLIAAVVASIPLCLSFAWYYGGEFV
jgi:hypothetical protein